MKISQNAVNFVGGYINGNGHDFRDRDWWPGGWVRDSTQGNHSVNIISDELLKVQLSFDEWGVEKYLDMVMKNFIVVKTWK